MPIEEEIDIEPRRYRWVEFGDSIDGKILASSSDGIKRTMLLEIDTRILKELILTGKLKRSEILEETEDRIKVEIPEEFIRDMIHLTCNPKVRCDCDFKGNPLPDITSRYQIALKNKNEHIRTLQLQVFDLQRMLRKSTTDKARDFKENIDIYVKPMLKELQPFRQRPMPSKLRKRSLEPI